MNVSSIILMAFVALFVSTAVYFISSGIRQISKRKSVRSHKARLESNAKICFSFGMTMVLAATASLVYLTDVAVSQPYANTDWFAPMFLVTGFSGVILWIVAFALHIKASAAETIDEYYWNSITNPPEKS